MAKEVLESDSRWRDSLEPNIESLYRGMVLEKGERRKADHPEKIPETGDRRRAAG